VTYHQNSVYKTPDDETRQLLEERKRAIREAHVAGKAAVKPAPRTRTIKPPKVGDGTCRRCGKPKLCNRCFHCAPADRSLTGIGTAASRKEPTS
jgi:hypothetical protein